jgi:hypothetical protein
MRVDRSDAGWQEREKDIRADAVIVSMSPPSYPSVWSHPCTARRSSTWLNHCTSHRDRRSDFEQPAGVGIGAVGVGSPCGYGGHGRSCSERERNALDSARSRLWSATSKSTTSRLGWLRSDLIVLLVKYSLVRTKSHKARQKAAGSALSVKLEKYLSRPDYEGHISFIETFQKGLPQDGIGCPRGIRTPRC